MIVIPNLPNPWWYSKMLEVTAGFLQSNIFNTTSKGTTVRFIFGSRKPLMNLRGQRGLYLQLNFGP